MRAVVCRSFAPLDQLTVEELPDLVPGPGQVLVEVEAAGANFVDALLVQGLYQLKPPLPFTPGMEVAGTVAALGEGVQGPAVGSRVLGSAFVGGFASQVLLPASAAVPIPAGLTAGQAAGLVQSYATMLFALTRRTHVDEGEWVAVLGAGGGIGLATVDVAKALGARVVACASTPEKLAAAKAAGGKPARAEIAVTGSLPCEIDMRADYAGHRVALELTNVRRLGRVVYRLAPGTFTEAVNDLARFVLGADDDFETVARAG